MITRPRLAATILLTLYALQSLTAALTHSSIMDEWLHINGGRAHWLDRHAIHAPEAGISAQLWQTLPVALWIAYTDRAPTPDSVSASVIAAEPFFSRRGVDGIPYLLIAARAMNTLLGIALGALIFVWSRNLFGVRGGLLSLTLFAFCPNMIAHGSLATPDLAAALMFLASTYALWRLLQRPSLARLAASCASVCLLVITKMSFFAILPLALVLLAARLASREPLELHIGAQRQVTRFASQLALYLGFALLHVLAALAVLWAVYDFQTVYDVGINVRQIALSSPHSGLASVRWAAAAAIDWLAQTGLTPHSVVEGLSRGLRLSDDRWTFLAGQYSQEGFWWFFPYAFLVKTPLPTLLLIAGIPLSCFVWWRRSRSIPHSVTPAPIELLPLAALLAIYGVVCLTIRFNIGHRHMLPMYPPLFVLCGAHALAWSERAPWQRGVVGVLVAAAIFAGVSIHPHHLAFFNSLVGGPKGGYKQLIDSSLDWGQDLPALHRYLSEHAEPDPNYRIYLSYFGHDQPAEYGIHARELPNLAGISGSAGPTDLRSGTYFISASMLAGTFLAFPGPWTSELEQEYTRKTREHDLWTGAVQDADARLALLATHGPNYFPWEETQLRHLRFARLCAYLRQRRPDDWVGYSILVFRLDDREVERALHGPAVQIQSSPKQSASPS